MMFRRPFALPLALVLVLASATCTEAASLMEWVCKRLKRDCSTFLKAVAVRSEADGRYGSRLVLYDPAAQNERVLWDCGACWSPAVLTPTELAVVSAQGLWVLRLNAQNSAAAPPVLVIPDSDLVRILGVSADSPYDLLVLRKEGPCCPRPAVASLLERAIRPLEGLPPGCLPRDRNCDVFGPRMDQERNGELLDTTGSTVGRPSRIRIGPMDGTGPRRLLMPDTPRWDDGASRLDPVWLGDRIVYVMSP